MILKRIGVDLGTTNILLFIPGRGIVINEPSVVALEVSKNRVMAIGTEAREMLGRTPESIIAGHPLKNGVIANFGIAKAMIRHYLNRLGGPIRLFRPEVMISIPDGATSTERRAVTDAVLQAGAKNAYLIKEPVAAALGAGIPIASPSGNMIIDIGGGTTEVAVISLAGIVYSRSLRVAGDKMDEAIIQYVKRKYNLLIGERTAEIIKTTIGNAYPDPNKLETIEVKGRDLVTGIPKILAIDSEEIREAISEQIEAIVETVKIALEQTPPELAADIVDRGIVLTGGGALLKNLDKLLREESGLPITVTEDPLSTVALGSGKMLDSLEILKQIVIV